MDIPSERVENLVGRKFGRWTVLEYAGNNAHRKATWRCRCYCGNEGIVTSGSLRSGGSKSCGCFQKDRVSEVQRANLDGKKFNRWTVISLSHTDANNHCMWNCVCDCGNTSVVDTQNLISGKSKSCGCYSRQRTSEIFSVDLTGFKTGRLTVIEFTGERRHGTRVWRCVCECGKECYKTAQALLSGGVQSCGCYKIDETIRCHTTHGMTGTPEYVRMAANKRRELKLKLDVEWTPEMEKSLIEFFPQCVLCGTSIDLETDHVLPLSKGYGLKVGNAIRLCGKCNLSKLNKMPDQLDERRRSTILSAAKNFEEYWNLNHGR